MATAPSLDNRSALYLLTRQRSMAVYLIIALYALTYAPLLSVLAGRLWNSEHYQFFPFAILGAGYLAYTQLGDISELAPGNRLLRSAVTVIVLLLTAVAVFLESPWLAAVVALTAVLSFLYFVGGIRLVRRLFPAWVVLSLAVPLPLGMDLQLVLVLQRVATHWASGCLDLLGYRHLVSGVVIKVPGHSFMIEEACSGVNSLFAALTCALFYAMLLRSGILRTAVLLAFTTLWVIAANAVRVALVTIAGSQWGMPLTEGVGHAAVGFVLFAVVVGLILSTERLLLYLVPRSREILEFLWGYLKQLVPAFVVRRLTVRTESKSEQGSPGSTAARSGFQPFGPMTWVSICGLVALVFLQASDLILAKSEPLPPDLLTSSDARLLPEEWNGWRLQSSDRVRRKANNVNGMFSRTWTYARGSLVAVVSLDGPFTGWHNLTNCLEGQGWRVASNVNRAYTELGEELGGGFTEVHSTQGLAEESLAIYASFDGEHRPYQPPNTYLQFRAVRRFPTPARMLRRVIAPQAGLGADDSTTYQLQVFLRSYSPIEAAQNQDLQALFHHIRSLVSTSL